MEVRTRNIGNTAWDVAVYLVVGMLMIGQSESTTVSMNTTTAEGVTLAPGTTVCYNLAGAEGETCFSNDPPFDNAFGFLPQSPRRVGTKFFLYTRNGEEQIYADDLASSTYLRKRKTKFLIHGYTGSIDGWIIPAVPHFLTLGDYNVIAVDWRSGALNLNYFKSAANTRLVGAQIGLMVNALKKTYKIKAKYVHIIGHSLGAQTAGYAGKTISKLGRITALDPAGPAFYNNDARIRVSRTDASFVDVLHTNGATSLLEGLGLVDAVGTADFYMNGGKDQPGCPDILCSHDRAFEYYVESVKQSCSYRSYRCEPGDDCLSMNRDCNSFWGRVFCKRAGYFSRKDHARGSYYTATTAEAPYC